MELTRTHGIDMDSWYRHGLMVLTTPMVFTQTDGIVSVLLDHTRTRGPSVENIAVPIIFKMAPWESV